MLRCYFSIVSLVFLIGCVHSTTPPLKIPTPALEEPVEIAVREIQITHKNVEIDIDDSAAFIEIEMPPIMIDHGVRVISYSVDIFATVVDHVRVYSALDWVNGHEPTQTYYILNLTPDPKLKYLYPDAAIY